MTAHRSTKAQPLLVADTAKRVDKVPAVDGLDALQILDALPHPILTVREDGVICKGNSAAEVFFDTSLVTPRRQKLASLLPRDSSLLASIAQRDYDVFDRSIDVHISSLRKKLGDDAKSPRWIETVRGVGYMLKKPECPG